MHGIFSILTNLPKYLRLSWRLMTDSRVPWLLKLIVVAAVIYGISPLDLIPEAFLPHMGLGEDFFLFVLSLWNLIRRSPEEVVTQHARQIALGDGHGDGDAHPKG